MKFWRTVKRYLIVYISLVIIFTVSLTIVCALPSGYIKTNIIKSVYLFEIEGDYPLVGGYQASYMLDNFTDSYMINIIYNIDSSKPLDAALRDVYYTKELPGITGTNRTQLLKSQIENNEPGNQNMLKYWNGFVVFIRPLLILFTYSDIRTILEIVFLFLFSTISILLYKKISIIATFAFASSMAFINFSIVPLSIQFSNIFAITFIFIIILLLIPDISIEKVTLLFFIAGASTCFVDLFSLPLFTFGLPAVVLMIIRRRQIPISSLKSDIIYLLFLGFSWMMGYALLWVSKWLLASIVFNDNVFLEGFNSILYRTSSVPSQLNNDTPLAIYAIASNLEYLLGYSRPIYWLLVYIVPGLFLIVFIFWHKKIRNLGSSLIFIFLASLPYLWYIVVANHSAVHVFITYRLQGVTIMAVFCAMYYAINIQNLIFDLKKSKQFIKSGINDLQRKYSSTQLKQ